MSKILVLGGANISSRELVWAALDRQLGRSAGIVEAIIHGGGAGAEYWASLWAASRKKLSLEYLPDEETWGRLKSLEFRDEEIFERHWDISSLLLFPGYARETRLRALATERKSVPITEGY